MRTIVGREEAVPAKGLEAARKEEEAGRPGEEPEICMRERPACLREVTRSQHGNAHCDEPGNDIDDQPAPRAAAIVQKPSHASSIVVLLNGLNPQTGGNACRI